MSRKSLGHCECKKVFNEFGELDVDGDLYVTARERLKSSIRGFKSKTAWGSVTGRLNVPECLEQLVCKSKLLN
jgi:hypothetical protein